MSLEFLQFTIPCETCIVQAICQDKKSVHKDINKRISLCLALPEWDINKKVHLKGLLECWANLGEALCQNLSSVKLENKRRMADDPKNSTSIPDEYIDFLTIIASTLQWVVNSTSWKKGELYNFDSSEIELKIKNVESYLRVKK